MRQMSRWMTAIVVVAGCTGLSRGQEAAKPLPEHEWLKSHEGVWEVTVDGEAEKAEVISKLDLGGLWVVSEFKGTMGGMPYHGRGMDGYDPAKKKYVTVWFDSMTAAPQISYRDYDAQAKTMTMTVEGPGPFGTKAKWKHVTKYLSKDEYTFTMSIVGDDGKETPMFKMDYKRRAEETKQKEARNENRIDEIKRKGAQIEKLVKEELTLIRAEADVKIREINKLLSENEKVAIEVLDKKQFELERKIDEIKKELEEKLKN